MNTIEKLGITPGPWLYKELTGGSARIGTEEDMVVASSGFEFTLKSQSVQRRNALLIASSPDMLEALIKYLVIGEGTIAIADLVHTELAFKDIVEKATGKTWQEIKELIDE